MPARAQIGDIIGRHFGRLTVTREAAPHLCASAKRRILKRMVECICDCEATVTVLLEQLTSGKTKSCGCLYRDSRDAMGRSRARHKMCSTPEYRAWAAMRNRCSNKDHDAYHDYGGRGIKVCKRWDRFELFFEDVGRRPSPTHSIDRYPDNDGDYRPGNVRWATKLEQRHNQRPHKPYRRRSVAA